MSRYKVIIVEADDNLDRELDGAIKDFMHSVQAKKGKVRIAYAGNKTDIIKTIDSLLDMEKLSK